jgi:hypothetical protein
VAQIDFFQSVGDALAGFLPPAMRNNSRRVSVRNLKVWFGDEHREHYEVQMLRRGKGISLEIGFHTEHADAQRNDEVMETLAKCERTWRKPLGTDAGIGPFVGPAKAWRRLSEFWGDGQFALDEETAVEAAERLAIYIRTLEPLRKPSAPARRARTSTASRS